VGGTVRPSIRAVWAFVTSSNLFACRTVERTFAWISRNRRLARDFERYATTVAAFIRLAMIRIMLRRLAVMNPIFSDGLL
jgi:Transposase DDE domain